MPEKVSEDKCVKRAEAARGQMTSVKGVQGKGGVLKSPTFDGLAGAAPYNRRKGK